MYLSKPQKLFELRFFLVVVLFVGFVFMGGFGFWFFGRVVCLFWVILVSPIHWQICTNLLGGK
jgi:hypothetical protein